MVDFVLLGHWIEVKSVMGASRALEQLAKLMPSDAHKLARREREGRAAGRTGGG